VDYRNDDSSFARPYEASNSTPDGTARVQDCCKACCSRVTLSNCVRGDKAEAAVGAQQHKGAAEEMRNEVSIAVRTLM